MRGTWTTTEGGGGGGGTIIGVIVAAVVIAAIAGPVAAAVTALVKALLIAVAVLVFLAGAGTVAVVVFRSRRSQPRAVLAPWHARVIPPSAQQVPAPHRPALERPRDLHLHFHGVTAEDVAAIIRDHQEP